MSCIVMEVYEETLVVLTNKGEFVEINNNGDSVSVGDRIQYNDYKSKNSMVIVIKKYGYIAATLLLSCVIGLSSYGATQPFGYVNLDINPSVVISYNWFEKVLEVNPLNEDGENVLTDLESVKSKELKEVIDNLVKISEDKGYISEKKTNVIYIAVSDKNSVKRSNSILEDLNDIKTPEIADRVIVLGNKKSYNKAKNTKESPTDDIILESIETQEESAIYSSTKPVQEMMKEFIETKKQYQIEVKEVRDEVKEMVKEQKKEAINEKKEEMKENKGELKGYEKNSNNSNNKSKEGESVEEIDNDVEEIDDEELDNQELDIEKDNRNKEQEDSKNKGNDKAKNNENANKSSNKNDK